MSIHYNNWRMDLAINAWYLAKTVKQRRLKEYQFISFAGNIEAKNADVVLSAIL